MNNREIIDYILSGNLKRNDVIKRTEHYYNSESVMYLWNDDYDLYDDNGKVSILSFRDGRKDLNGNINTYYTYEIITNEEAENEIIAKEKQKRIEELKEELRKLKGE